MEMESRMSLQSLPDSDVFSPCSIDHQDVFMYEDDKRVVPCVRGESDSPTYLDISTSKSSSFPSMKQELDTDTLMSWTQKHPEHWSQNEILDWIYFVASTIEVDPTTIRGEGFQNITGPELCRMSLEDFQKRDPVNGQCFFDMFRALHKDAIFIGPLAGDFNQPDPYWDYSARQDIKTEQQYDNQEQESTDSVTKLLDCQMLSDKEMQVMVGKYWYTVDCASLKDFDEALHEVAENYTQWPIDNGYGGSDSESMSDASEIEMANTSVYSSRIYRDKKYSTGSDVLSDDEYPLIVPTTVEKPTKARKPSTPRKKPTGEQNKQQNRGRKPGQISKGNHLWEFIRDLLKDPKFNPHLLRWEEKETGVFRFVQSEAVAQMWGRKKNNPGMTYEKLSRAMRFCRTAGYFAEVPKTGKFPKKLCFRFGVKAFGWKD